MTEMAIMNLLKNLDNYKNNRGQLFNSTARNESTIMFKYKACLRNKLW